MSTFRSINIQKSDGSTGTGREYSDTSTSNVFKYIKGKTMLIMFRFSGGGNGFKFSDAR